MITVCFGFIGSPASAAVEGWEEPILIQTNLDYTQCESLGMDDQGNAMVVWEHPEGNISDQPGIWARTYNRVLGWSEPEMIFDSDYWWGRTTMKMAPNGRAVAAWGTYQETDSTLGIIARMYDPVSGWAQPQDVATGLTSLGDVEVALNSDGDAVCIWGGLEELSASVYGIDTGWSTPVPIDLGGFNPAAAVDDLGNALVVWTTGDPYALKSIRYSPGEGWGDVTVIGTAVHIYQPTMCMDDSGDAMVVWRVYDGSLRLICASRYSPGSGWTAPETIGPAEGGLYPNSLDVGAGRPGEYQVIWEQSDSSGADSAWARRWTQSTGWEDPVRLSATGHTYYYMWTSISVNCEGQAVAVWTQGGDEPIVDVRISRYVPDVGWMAPEVIDNSDTLNAFFGRAEMDPLGNIVATWKLDFGQCWLWGASYKAHWAPDVMIGDPLDGTVTTDPAITVRGYAEAYADLTVNGIQVQVQPDCSFEVQVELVPGDNLIVARATDDVGNFTETSVTVTYVGGVSDGPTAVMDITEMKNWKTLKFDGRLSTDDVKVVGYLWDFGDGESADSKVCVHSYQKAGEYVVTLTVWDGDGNSDSASITLLIRQPGSGT